MLRLVPALCPPMTSLLWKATLSLVKVPLLMPCLLTGKLGPPVPREAALVMAERLHQRPRLALQGTLGSGSTSF